MQTCLSLVSLDRTLSVSSGLSRSGMDTVNSVHLTGASGYSARAQQFHNLLG